MRIAVGKAIDRVAHEASCHATVRSSNVRWVVCFPAAEAAGCAATGEANLRGPQGLRGS
jgi:hypothetical protein